MGNAPSRTAAGGGHSPSPSPGPVGGSVTTATSSGAGTGSIANQSHVQGASGQQQNVRKEGRRRESLHAAKSAPRPSASLESATAQSAGQSLRTATESLRQSSVPPVPIPKARTSADTMGSYESKPVVERSAASARASAPAPLRPASSSGVQDNAELPQSPAPIPIPLQDETLDSLAPSEYNRPPRLPLPIGEEIYAPGSPIFSPQHLQDNVDPLPLDPGTEIPRPLSVLSGTTVEDEEDPGDELEYPPDQAIQTVPTLLEWYEGGDKVYVTGTFANWDRKIKLRKDGPSRRRNALSAMIHFPPGTHHIKFIVDNDMRTAKHLPTAVDFAGFLVNYIEVLPVAPPSAATGTPPATAPVDIPSAPGNKQHGRSPDVRLEARIPPGVHPPQILPPTPELASAGKPAAEAEQVADKDKEGTQPARIVKGPPKRYHSEIPQFLLDLDAPEESPKLIKANAACLALPAPPSLPMFLAKSILNKDAPMRDDVSVLVLPNHTVLNHLATSSIKNRTLATSATTRYKKKFLTTIMYKPTSERA